MSAAAPSQDGVREVTSFCRICGGGCGTRLKIDSNDRILHIRGDDQQPMSKGYACFKGLQAEEAHHGPARLLRPLKRQPDGTFAEIGLEQALDEIAEVLRPFYESDDREAIALFNGNGSTPCSSAHGMHYSFMESLGTKSHYTTLTIDQSAKLVSFERLGGWPGGLHALDQSDVVLFFGTNPLLSHSCIGCITADPTRRLKKASGEGLKMIMVDPRRNETSHYATLMLQPIPGQDAAIAAALIRIVMDEGWGDADFTARFATPEGLAALRAAVEPFTPELVERNAGLNPGDIRAAAELFARDNKRGAAFTATGPSMAPYSNVMQHLVDALNVICGRYRRAADRIAVDMLSPEYAVHEEVISPPRSWQAVPDSRIRGVGSLFRERLSGTLPEEILTPGKGQVRCLIVSGANPASSIPDSARMAEALRALDLLVAIEPYMTATAKMAHYILPPKMQYERADLPLSIPGFSLFPDNWTQYTPPLLKPPAGSDVCDDWYPFWAIAKRLGFAIDYVGKGPLPMDEAPSTDDLLAIRLQGARVSLEEVKKYPSGHIWDVDSCFILPGREGVSGRFDLMPADVAQELQAFRALPVTAEKIESRGQRFSHLLSSRRLRDIFNSNGPQLGKVRTRNPYNALYLNPGDIAALGAQDGDVVRITSDHGSILAVAEADGTMRTGVVSLAHGWGGHPDATQADAQFDGAANVNELIACDTNVESINAMPRMSAIPVNLERTNIVFAAQGSVAVEPALP